jgi:branched-chain amino acid transport system permease protein
VLSGFISAFAGILIAPFLFASTVMGMIVGLKGFAVAILGGLCSGKGAIIAGLLLGVIEKLGGAVLGDGYRNIVCFGVLIVVLVFRPQGMFGIKISVKA